MFNLDNKYCVLTAAGQGIGWATAVAFAKAGGNVLATDINTKTLAALAQQHPNIKTAVLDVTDTVAVTDFCHHQSRVDVLFNCAGWVAAGDILTCSQTDWDNSWRLNVTAMFRLIQGLLPVMLENNGASIINMSSAASSVKGVPNRFAYSVTKAAVIGLTKSIAADYITQGIRCNAICPGTVDSPSLAERIKEQAQQQGKTTVEVYSDFVARQPMGRIGKPEEIAALALYFASDASSFTTGTNQVIDGGWSN
ncbi:MAG: SDR family oxidoreductase [Ostreibacterium sp.]